MTTSLMHTVFQVGLMLGLVICLILLMGWMAKKTQGFGLQGGKHFKILQSIPLGQKEKAVLIELDGNKILLGVTTNQISILWSTSVTGPEKEYLDKSLVADAGSKPEDALSFSQYLKKIMSRDTAC